MAEFENLLQPYNIETVLAADHGHDCLVVDLGGARACLDPVADDFVQGVDNLFSFSLNQIESATKLYVLGEWMHALDSAKTNLVLMRLCDLIVGLHSLTELTWISGLTFTEPVWGVLPRSLSKFVVNVGQPVAIDGEDSDRKSYLSQEGMKPLLGFTKLRELRLFGMRDSYQSIIWETVFRNEADGEGMIVLDLQMNEAPLVRQENWIRGNEVIGLRVSNEDPQAYRGIDGKGILHHNYGTGEYLDDYCMRKARIASGLDEAKQLPLWCLKLDGFVVDDLPFEHELSRVVLLTCGDSCVDAGLRAPRTQYARNKWASSVNSDTTHCLIVWPQWAAIYDTEGRRLDPDGNISSDTEGYVKVSAPPEVAPLTTEHLHMKDLNEAIEEAEKRDSPLAPYPTIETFPSGLGSQTTLEVASIASTRGSVVPTSSDESSE